MSALLSRSAPVGARDLDSRLTRSDGPRRRRNRVAEWMRANWATLSWLTPIVVIAAVANSVNLAGSPAPTEGEGTIVAQAWAVGHLGQLTPYAYTYDHPPLGWIQLAALNALTGLFTPGTLLAAREVMVAAALVSVVLLWFVARRIGFGRSASGIATIVFALSPLAIQLHRTVYLDNIATPWLLASLLLATTRRRQILGFAGSAVALGIAVLSQETYLLALPLVAVVAWRSARPDTRRYALSVAASILVLIFGAFVMFAVLRGQFLPGADHPSLVGGIASKFGASGSGSSTVETTLDQWRRLDPMLLFVAPAVGIAGLFLRRTRPFAITLLALIAVLFVFRSDGSLPLSYAVLLLPIVALALAGVVDHVIRLGRFGVASTWLRIVAIVAALAVAATALGFAWGPSLNGLLTRHDQVATAQAEHWIARNVPKDSRLLVDDSMWLDLVNAGYARDNVVWYPKLDSDKAVEAQSPRGWKDSDYVVSTPSMRISADAASADEAIANSVVVASFGAADQRIQVRRIVPAGAAAAKADLRSEQAQRANLGNEITANPRVKTDAADAAALRSGSVDPRVSLLVTQLAPIGMVTVSRFPVVAGEAGLPIREVVLSRVDGKSLSSNGRLTATGRAVVATLNGPLLAQSSRVVPDGILVEFPIGLPAGIIQ